MKKTVVRENVPRKIEQQQKIIEHWTMKMAVVVVCGGRRADEEQSYEK